MSAVPVTPPLSSASDMEQVLAVMQEEEQHFVERRVAQYEQLRLSLVGAKWSQQKKHLEVAAEKMEVRCRALKQVLIPRVCFILKP